MASATSRLSPASFNTSRPESGLSPEVADIPSSDYPTPARRPLNSRLHCAAITRDFDIPRPDWRDGLTAIVKELRP